MEKSKKSQKHSQIIIDVAAGKKRLTDALFELKILLSDLDNSEVNSWIESELSGYKKGDVPEYRKLRGTMFGTLQYVSMGAMINRKMAIPVKVDKLDSTNVNMTDNITTIENYANSEDSSDLSIPVDLRIANHIADLEISAYCQIMSAGIKIPPSKFTDIINGVKQRVLDVLIMLEKRHGNLDNYTVSFGSKKEKAEAAQTIIQIIHNGDQISVGDNNKIDKSAIGKDNEN